MEEVVFRKWGVKVKKSLDSVAMNEGRGRYWEGCVWEQLCLPKEKTTTMFASPEDERASKTRFKHTALFIQ